MSPLVLRALQIWSVHTRQPIQVTDQQLSCIFQKLVPGLTVRHTKRAISQSWYWRHLNCPWERNEVQALLTEESRDLEIEIRDLLVGTENILKVMIKGMGTKEVIQKTDVNREEMSIIGQIQKTEDISPDLARDGITGKARLGIETGDQKVGTGIEKSKISIERHQPGVKAESLVSHHINVIARLHRVEKIDRRTQIA